MEEKKTLFDFLYQILHHQIVSGYLKYKTALPSANSLCEMYHVGIRTVKDVLSALKAEGLIQTEERKSAVVIYRHPDLTDDLAAGFVLERKRSILEAYETLTLLFPPILAFSAQHGDRRNIGRQMQKIKHTKTLMADGRSEAYPVLLYSLLERTNNLLLNDLYISLELFIRIPFSFVEKPSAAMRSACSYAKKAEGLIEALGKQDTKGIETFFKTLFQLTGKAAKEYLEELEDGHPNVEEDEESVYCWIAERGRDHYYTQIVRDLIDKIGLGIYPDRTFLPSEAVLAGQYGVSVSTVRKALAMLNELGFGRTYNAKGTMVLLSDDQATLQCMKNKTYRRDTLLYLSGLQLLAFAIRPAARLAFERIGREQQAALWHMLQKSDSIPLNLMVDCILDNLTLRPLKTIIQQTAKLLHWGYYFSFFDEKQKKDDILYPMSMEAFHALEAGDRDGFAERLSGCYCHILTFVREFMIQCGLPEAERLLIPVFDVL